MDYLKNLLKGEKVAREIQRLNGELIASAPALTTQLAGRDRRIAELEEIILIAKVALGNIAEDRLAISHKEYARGQRERIDEHLAALKGKL